MSKLFKYNRPQLCAFLSGCLASAINGGAFPIIAILLSDMITILSKYGTPKDQDKRETESDKYCLGFLMTGVGALIATTLSTYFFTRVGETVTLRLRNDVFKKMMSMTGSWFDLPANNPGSLAARLASDAHLVN